MDHSIMVPLQVYELLLIYQVLGDQLVEKFCYQSPTDDQAVQDALTHVNTITDRMGTKVISLEVFCAEIGFRGMNLLEPDLITNYHERRIYATDDLDSSLVKELPLQMS